MYNAAGPLGLYLHHICTNERQKQKSPLKLQKVIIQTSLLQLLLLTHRHIIHLFHPWARLRRVVLYMVSSVIAWWWANIGVYEEGR